MPFNACQGDGNSNNIDLIFILTSVFLFFSVSKISCLQFVYSLGLLIEEGKGNWNAELKSLLIDKFHSTAETVFTYTNSLTSLQFH